jgi:hypothetical protein
MIGSFHKLDSFYVWMFIIESITFIEVFFSLFIMMLGYEHCYVRWGVDVHNVHRYVHWQ